MARRTRTIDRPGGVVANYVPFYFAPRSPMMNSIHHGNVATYQLSQAGLVWLVNDRNARLSYAEFRGQDETLDHVDWDLMRSRWWNNTTEFRTAKERRMAECLVHERVPWPAFQHVVTKKEATAVGLRAMLSAAGQATPITLSQLAGTSDGMRESCMITQAHGNLLEAGVDALVSTVNTVGVMGKGIALQF